ncbi:cyclin-dependent kinase inhibitor 1B-like [Actinia tenebrosa]|uniref:Cyclin-dependent kinase inhibitor 1B-like n=1 Tax=Actinia tenebrosa TaxID=6105 RepID=A0A6P8HDD4_ACTTE|nr:cyclin-dependent kinase inhibitor 1B-like [Actinia tenebrosa]
MALTEVQWRSIVTQKDPTDVSPSLGVRRCLFGPVDHSETRAHLQREMKTMVEDGIRRWNFDFEKGTPLKGRYLWHKTPSNDVQNDIPSSSITLNSRISTLRDSSCTKSADVELNSSATTTTTTSITCENSTTQTSKITEQNPRKRVPINKITGFLKQKKPKLCSKIDKDTPSFRRQTRSSVKQAGQMRLDKFLN